MQIGHEWPRLTSDEVKINDGCFSLLAKKRDCHGFRQQNEKNQDQDVEPKVHERYWGLDRPHVRRGLAITINSWRTFWLCLRCRKDYSGRSFYYNRTWGNTLRKNLVRNYEMKIQEDYFWSNSLKCSRIKPTCISSTSNKSPEASSWIRFWALARASPMLPCCNKVAVSLRVIFPLESFFSCNWPSRWLVNLSWAWTFMLVHFNWFGLSKVNRVFDKPSQS